MSLKVSAWPRLIFTPDRSNFGRFRQVIDAINSCPTM
jgi:hypothetical protein